MCYKEEKGFVTSDTDGLATCKTTYGVGYPKIEKNLAFLVKVSNFLLSSVVRLRRKRGEGVSEKGGWLFSPHFALPEPTPKKTL